MTAADIAHTVQEHVTAAKLALEIAAGGFDHACAERALLEGRGDLVAVGRPFLANPDLVERMRHDAPLNAPDAATFDVPGPKGYIDYSVLGA